jgi:type II secretory pathway pseudopilin PulG
MNRRGFTLIELVIYTGITAMILASLIFITNVMYDARARVRTSAIVHEHVQFAVDRVTASVREASGVSAPALGSTSTTLQLVMADASINPTKFSVTSGQMFLQMGASTSLPITSTEIRITSATFTAANTSPPTVRIEISANKTNASGPYDAPFTLSGTATIRRVH